MAHAAILLAACLLAASGCKKGDHDASPGAADYYISFKVDGVQKKYTSQAVASLGYASQDKLYNAVLQGYQGAASATGAHMGIFLFDQAAIAKGSYMDPQKATNAGGDQITKVMINYYDDAGNGYLSMGAMVDENGNPLPGVPGAVADAQVTITKLSSAGVEGTFSGTLALATGTSTVKITEGKFILKRLQ